MRDNLRNARLNKGFPKLRLALLVGIDPNTYNNIEHGRGGDKNLVLWKNLSEILEEPISYLREKSEYKDTKLKHLRLAKSMTQKQVAKYCGISEEGYRLIECGVRNAIKPTWEKLSELFETTIDYESNKKPELTQSMDKNVLANKKRKNAREVKKC